MISYIKILYRFHILSEFDNGKRSCRKRLADHNRRRRKSHQVNQENQRSQLENAANPSSDILTSKLHLQCSHTRTEIYISNNFFFATNVTLNHLLDIFMIRLCFCKINKYIYSLIITINFVILFF